MFFLVDIDYINMTVPPPDLSSVYNVCGIMKMRIRQLSTWAVEKLKYLGGSESKITKNCLRLQMWRGGFGAAAEK